MNKPIYKIFLSPFFIFCLFLLLLNDFFLKQQFHNFLTGKLSDFAGLFVFPLFFAAFFPKRRLAIYISTAILFIFWKSPFSQSLIDFWNLIVYFKIWRVVDYTDLLALSVLPLSYFYFETETQKQKTFSLSFAKRAFVSFVVLLSVFAFTATSFADEQNISIDKEYKFKLSELEIDGILKQNERIQDLKIERQTDRYPTNEYSDLKVNPNTFFAHFSLNQKICDTNYPRVYFYIEREREFSKITSASISFRCQAVLEQKSNTAYKQYIPEVIGVFEREVIEKLRQNSPQ